MKIIPGADIRTVNMRDLTSGVLHTKFWIVDKKHIYIGSANMDWRSLTQVLYTHTHTRITYRINESSFWFVGKRAGDSYLQLQLPGCRPGEDLWSLLVPGWQSVSPVTVAGQIHHPLQQGHAPPAATQQHAIQGLFVCKIFIILWFQPYEICYRCVFTVGSIHTNKNDHICFPFHSEFPSIPLCSWQDSGPPVHPQRHGGCPELHLHRCHELPAHDGVLTP